MSRGPIPVEEYLSVPGARVALVEHTEDGRTAPALARIAELAPWLVVTTLKADAPPVPRIEIARSDQHGAATFLGPVQGRLLEPFVELLRALATGEVEWETPATRALLAELARPVDVTLAVSAGCPYCPAVTAALLRALSATPRLSVVVARADLGFVPGVGSVPTLLVGGHALAQGPVGEYALTRILVDSAR